jgi:class 3 adenylate cyclase
MAGQSTPVSAFARRPVAAQRSPVATGEFRRQVSVLFCDLVGSTALSADLDPEDLHSLLAGYHAVAAKAVERFGGHFHHTYGDGLMVSWGYPQAFEDDAVRAVLAGLEIIEALRWFNAANPAWPQLSARVAIHTGLAVIADRWLGTQHEVGNVVGETPNLAARLQALAQPNTVIISDATEDLIRNRFTVIPVPVDDLRGVGRPMRAYRVVGVADENRPGLDVANAQIVGRSAECAQIEQAWVAVSGRSKGKVLVLRGEPGVGKSLLAYYATQLAAADGAEQAVMRCSSLHMSDAFYPARRMIERALCIDSAEPVHSSRSRLLAYADGHPGLSGAELALLAALIGVPPGDGIPAVELVPERRRERTFEMLISFIGRLANSKPCLLVVEDVHWSDPSTLELLRRMATGTPAPGVLVVLTMRSGGPPWRFGGEEIEVVPLGPDDVFTLVQSVSPGISNDLVAAVIERSDGIPLFAVELARYLVRTKSSTPVDVPPRLQDLLVARLDLHPDERQLAQVLAVIGTSAPRSLVEGASDRPVSDVRRGLGVLVEAGILRDEGPVHDPIYRFRHVLLREAAYNTALRSRRRQVHGRVADILRGSLGVGHPCSNLIAHHLEEAGRLRESLVWWRRAASAAAEVAGHREVVEYLRHLLAMLPVAGPTPEVDEIDVLVALGVSLVALEGYTSKEVAAVHERARALFESPATGRAPLPGAFYPVWAYHHVRGELRQSTLLSKRLLAGFATTPDPQRALAAAMVGFDLFERGLLRRAVPLLEEAARDAVEPMPEVPHDIWSAVTVLGGVGRWMSGELDVGRVRVAAAIERADQLDLPKGPFTRAFVHSYAAWWLLLVDDAEAAAKHAQCAIDEARANGFITWNVASLMHAAAAAVRSGEAGGAVETLLNGLDMWRLAGAEAFRPVFLRWLAEAYAAAGDASTALSTLDDAIDHAGRFGGRIHEPELHRSLGRLLRDQGRRRDAEREFRAAAALAARQGARSFELRARLDLAATLPPGEAAAERLALARIAAMFSPTVADPFLLQARQLGGER